MDPAELASSLRITISTLHKGLRKQMYSVHEYSMTEMETIGLLMKEDHLLPSQLALITRVKTQSMSQILNKLQAQGVIKRIPSKEDKRKVYIVLTSFGKKMIEKTKYDRDEWLMRAMEKSLSKHEMEILIKSLPVLNKLIDAR